MRRANEVGCNLRVSKPLKKRALLETISRYVPERRGPAYALSDGHEDAAQEKARRELEGGRRRLALPLRSQLVPKRASMVLRMNEQRLGGHHIIGKFDYISFSVRFASRRSVYRSSTSGHKRTVDTFRRFTIVGSFVFERFRALS